MCLSQGDKMELVTDVPTCTLAQRSCVWGTRDAGCGNAVRGNALSYLD